MNIEKDFVSPQAQGSSSPLLEVFKGYGTLNAPTATKLKPSSTTD